MVDSLFLMRLRRSLVVLAALLGLVLPGLVVPGCAATPNIVLITLDTTRADRMGFLGSKRGLTPNLDALARQSVVFSHAYSHVPLTTASHATILTGTYPQYNQVNDFGRPLPETVPYLPDILHRRGYHTAAFVSALVLDPLDGLAPGFDRGFDIYNAGFRLRRGGEDRYQTVERRGGEVIGRALKWVQTQRRAPFFLWIHLYDAHDPYDPPAPFKQRYSSAPYDGEIAYVDSAVGQFLKELRAEGMFENTAIAVMADHGEALGEHGEGTHGIFLYDETIHVPLLVKMPAERLAGARIETRAGLVDVAPTLLQLARATPPPQMQGESLLPLMQASAPQPRTRSAGKQADSIPAKDRPAYAETDYPERAFGWSALRSLRTSNYLFIDAPERELYDSAADPQASRNLVKSRPAVTDTLASQLTELKDRFSRSAPTQEGIDPQQAQKLNALGYVASDVHAAKSATKNSKVADPKDKVEIANLMHDAVMEVEDGRYEEAVPKLQRVLADEPNMAVAQMQLGAAYTRLKDYPKAVPALTRALELRPDSSMGHYELGLALFEVGQTRNFRSPQCTRASIACRRR
jgi:choline-sulfatase